MTSQETTTYLARSLRRVLCPADATGQQLARKARGSAWGRLIIPSQRLDTRPRFNWRSAFLQFMRLVLALCNLRWRTPRQVGACIFVRR